MRPIQLRMHKHHWIAAAIAQNLLCRTAPVSILKVTSHNGVIGNEAADRLAAEFMKLMTLPASTTAHLQILA